MIHISTSSSKINNNSLVGVLQNGPKPQLSILKEVNKKEGCVSWRPPLLVFDIGQSVYLRGVNILSI